jgi:hypothetical protein
MDRGPAGESTVSLIKRTLTTDIHLSGNQSITSTQASHKINELLGVGWRTRYQLPRLLDLLKEDPVFDVLPLCPGEKKIQLKPQPHVPFPSGAGAHPRTSQPPRRSLRPAAPPAAATVSFTGATPSTADWEASALLRAADYAWSSWQSNPEVFLKHALARHLVERRTPGAEIVKLPGPQAGKLNQDPMSLKTSSFLIVYALDDLVSRGNCLCAACNCRVLTNIPCHTCHFVLEMTHA